MKLRIFCGILFSLSFFGCALSKPALQFSPENLPSGEVGKPYSVTIQIQQNQTPVGDISLAQNTLPPGLSFAFRKESRDAEIKGTPTTTGTFRFTLSAWCYGTQTSGQNGQKEYSIQIQ